MAEVRIETLQPGRKFRSLGRTGRLLRLTPGCAVVRYDEGRDVMIAGEVAFRAPGRELTISRGAEVEPL